MSKEIKKAIRIIKRRINVCDKTIDKYYGLKECQGWYYEKEHLENSIRELEKVL